MSTKRQLPVVGSMPAATSQRVARRLCQALALVSILISPLLGGWQRLERNYLAGWDGREHDLPSAVQSLLPGGEVAANAYEANRLLGGGVASSYLGLPFIDPVVAPTALENGELTLLVGLGALLPVLLGVLAGRAFCGWFCPFGTMARVLEATLRRLPWRPRALAVPQTRSLRHGLLAAIWVLSLGFGVHLAHVFLPHALLQQSVYAFWLLGGGGAAFAWFLGLLVSAIVLGPTAYCATACPTGAVLSLLGRRKLAQVTLRDPAACGAHCNLCARACWLSLRPDLGDPGPDCDSCARCFEVCPRTNLILGLRAPTRRQEGTA